MAERPQGDPGVLGLAWKRYLHQLNTRPLRTKLLTTRKVQWRRTVAFALYGFLWSGPANHYWQNFLQKLFKGRNDPKTVVKKVIVENLTFAPFANAMMMSFISLVLEGRSINGTKEKLRRDFPPVIFNAWRQWRQELALDNSIVNLEDQWQFQTYIGHVWPLASLINYRYVPLHLRVPFVSVLALCWSIFLIVSSKKTPPAPVMPQLPQPATE